jgi:hypothetical protein
MRKLSVKVIISVWYYLLYKVFVINEESQSNKPSYR